MVQFVTGRKRRSSNCPSDSFPVLSWDVWKYHGKPRHGTLWELRLWSANALLRTRHKPPLLDDEFRAYTPNINWGLSSRGWLGTPMRHCWGLQHGYSWIIVFLQVSYIGKANNEKSKYGASEPRFDDYDISVMVKFKKGAQMIQPEHFQRALNHNDVWLLSREWWNVAFGKQRNYWRDIQFTPS